MTHPAGSGGAVRQARRWCATTTALLACLAAVPPAHSARSRPVPTATPTEAPPPPVPAGGPAPVTAPPQPAEVAPAPAVEPPPAGANPVPAPSPAVAWTELHYAAHKLFLSASTTIRTAWVPAPELAAVLRHPERGRAVAAPSGGAVAVSLASELPFGRDERVTLWLDPATGAALGGEKTSLGGSAYHKFMRFTEEGLYTWRSSPRNAREAALGPDGWTGRSNYLVRPAVRPPQETPVTDPYALLYLVSAARLDRKDSALGLVMLSGDRYVEISFAAGGLSLRRESFRESWPGGARRRDGNVLVRTVHGTARAIGAAEATNDVDLGFLGMRGSLTLFVEVGTGIPVAFSGRVDYLGTLTVGLTRAVLAAPPQDLGAPEPSPTGAAAPEPSPTGISAAEPTPGPQPLPPP